MLKLTSNDITLNQSHSSKFDAIRSIASNLVAQKFVVEGYGDGMLSRENQHSTYLGNGIAIPHGTTDTRDLVQQTGVSIQHFPDGVEWGDGNTVFLAIGIAAKSDEHLGILKQLTNVLSSDGIEQQLQQANTTQQIIAILNGETQTECDFDSSLIQLNFPATDMVQLSVVAAGLLKNKQNASNEFVAELVTKSPTHLGSGLWITSSSTTVTRTGMSFVSNNTEFQFEGKPVRALIGVAACNNAHQPQLIKICDLIANNQQEHLLSCSKDELLALLAISAHQGSHNSNDVQQHDDTQTYTIRNSHGLHARPGAMLVAEAKKYDAKIQVANLDGEGKFVNAKSLMKVIGLGVLHGHQLQFVADGADASDALNAIGAAIESGLGEK